MRDRFATYHPLINFIFFIGALICSMFLLHPGFLACSLALAVCYYLTVQGWQGLKFIRGMCVLFVVLAVVNPLFNTMGEIVLFTYWKGRPYTLEALYYGIALAAMMASLLIWFACYNAVMTSDKFLYLFGKMAPSVTLVLTMVLRLIPSYRQKLLQMNGARRGIGLAMDSGTNKEKARHGLILVSAMTSWALEGGVITADSMRSRGYGCGRRTTFSRYRFETRDKTMAAVMALLLGIVFFCCIKGAADVTYLPQVQINGADDPYMMAGLLAYFTFLLIPSAVNIWEEIRWHSLKSKI